jgi:1,4-dihydroxy-2-naphthoyl-CoA hydrolase
MLNQNISIEALNQNSAHCMPGHLGIEITEVGTDYICGKMPVDARTKQPMGLLHGGASVVLAESLGSVGAFLAVDINQYYCVGLEINANHIRSAREGFVYGKATIVHAGKTTQVWDIRITDEENKLVCISRLTVAVVKKEAK